LLNNIKNNNDNLLIMEETNIHVAKNDITKKVLVRSLDGFRSEYEISDSMTFDDFFKKIEIGLKVVNPSLPNNIKLITKGMILGNNNFDKIENNSVILCIVKYDDSIESIPELIPELIQQSAPQSATQSAPQSEPIPNPFNGTIQSDRSKKILVKTLDGYSAYHRITNNQKLDDLIISIRRDMGSSNIPVGDVSQTMKLLYCGMILTNNNFNDILDGSTVLCVPVTGGSSERSTQSTQSTQSSQSIQSTQSTQSSQPIQSTSNYSLKQCKAGFVVFLNLIHTNSQMRNLFETNMPQLMNELVTNPQIDEIFGSIMSQSSQILRSMETGENISVNINTNSNSMDMVEMNKEDQQNVEQLAMMGFDRNRSIVMYLECGKNLEETVRRLLE
jgi:hypothetical protein